MIDFFQLIPLLGSLIVVVVTVAIIIQPLPIDYCHCTKVAAVMLVGFFVGIPALILIAVVIARDLFDTP